MYTEEFKVKKIKQTNSKKYLSILGVMFILVVITILSITTNKKPSSDFIATNTKGELIINKKDIGSTASFLSYDSKGTYMEIIAVKAKDGTIRTALNTCQVCYSSGRGYYEQLGEKLICNNCGNQFNIDQIEVERGGCNPVPILDDMKTEDQDTIAIKSAALDTFATLFANWKK